MSNAERSVAPSTESSTPSRGNLLHALTGEWYGEGRLCGRGSFTEVGWGNATLLMGLLMICVPEAAQNAHILGLVVNRFSLWMVATPAILSGTMTDVGVVLFFIRGRCFASRMFRFFGSAVGLALWIALFLSALFTLNGEFAMLPVYGWAVLGYARTLTHAWRRI